MSSKKKKIVFGVKTSKHTTKFANKTKLDNLSTFITEYRRVGQLIIDHIWNNGYKWEDKTGKHYEFSIQKNLLKFPSFVDYNQFDIDTFLTGRALSSLVTQLAGMINAECEKQRKRIYMLQVQKEEGKSKKQRKLLANRIKQNIPQKPNCSNINAELSSKCCDFQEINGEFDGFIKLKSITKQKMEIKIPIKYHKHSRKLSKDRDKLNSYLINESFINIRWKKELPQKKTSGIVIGADQGMKDVLTCSDKQTTPNKDSHNHSLESIMRKLASCKKGSKAFKRAQSHRKNFINWSINQLHLSNVKEIRLEKVWNIGYKSKTSRLMQHWTNTLIRDKVESICVESGVQLKHQSSTYRSQRCSGCGVVRKANRKGKIYTCKHCGLQIDADYNASCNHIVDLPEIPYKLRKLQMNRGHL